MRYTEIALNDGIVDELFFNNKQSAFKSVSYTKQMMIPTEYKYSKSTNSFYYPKGWNNTDTDYLLFKDTLWKGLQEEFTSYNWSGLATISGLPALPVSFPVSSTSAREHLASLPDDYIDMAADYFSHLVGNIVDLERKNRIPKKSNSGPPTMLFGLEKKKFAEAVLSGEIKDEKFKVKLAKLGNRMQVDSMVYINDTWQPKKRFVYTKDGERIKVDNSVDATIFGLPKNTPLCKSRTRAIYSYNYYYAARHKALVESRRNYLEHPLFELRGISDLKERVKGFKFRVKVDCSNFDRSHDERLIMKAIEILYQPFKEELVEEAKEMFRFALWQPPLDESSNTAYLIGNLNDTSKNDFIGLPSGIPCTPDVSKMCGSWALFVYPLSLMYGKKPIQIFDWMLHPDCPFGGFAFADDVMVFFKTKEEKLKFVSILDQIKYYDVVNEEDSATINGFLVEETPKGLEVNPKIENMLVNYFNAEKGIDHNHRKLSFPIGWLERDETVYKLHPLYETIADYRDRLMWKMLGVKYTQLALEARSVLQQHTPLNNLTREELEVLEDPSKLQWKSFEPGTIRQTIIDMYEEAVEEKINSKFIERNLK